ncbi:MAG: beta-galactosidase [Candidatus Spechtbacterales bacterium]
MLYRFSKALFALVILIYAGFVVAYVAVAFSTPAPTRGAWQATLTSSQTVEALLAQHNPNHVRVGVPWSEVAPRQGEYDFSAIEAILAILEARGVKATLVLGYTQPGREAACSLPAWVGADGLDPAFTQSLFQYLRAATAHFKDTATVVAWQIENDPFTTHEGCPSPDARLLALEKELVTHVAPSRPVVVESEPALSKLTRHAQNVVIKLSK